MKVTTVSRSGKFSPRSAKGAAYLTVNNEGNDVGQIAVQVNHKNASGGEGQEKALINVTFADGTIWSGNFETLKIKLL